jgi:hypothetical protein
MQKKHSDSIAGDMDAELSESFVCDLIAKVTGENKGYE